MDCIEEIGYDNDIKLRDDLIAMPIKRAPDQVQFAAHLGTLLFNNFVVVVDCQISFRTVSIILPVTYAFRWLCSYYCTCLAWCSMNKIQKTYTALGLLPAL